MGNLLAAPAASSQVHVSPVLVVLGGLAVFLLLGIYYLKSEPPLVKLIHLLFGVLIGIVVGAILGSPAASPATAHMISSITSKLTSLSTIPLAVVLLVLAAGPSIISVILSRRGK
jgi:hypothetical protein